MLECIFSSLIASGCCSLRLTWEVSFTTEPWYDMIWCVVTCRSSLAGYRLSSPSFPTSPYCSLAASPLSPFGPSSSLFGRSSSSPVTGRSPASKQLRQQQCSPARTTGSASSLFNSVSALVDSPRFVKQHVTQLLLQCISGVFSQTDWRSLLDVSCDEPTIMGHESRLNKSVFTVSECVGS